MPCVPVCTLQVLLVLRRAVLQVLQVLLVLRWAVLLLCGGLAATLPAGLAPNEAAA